MPCCRPSSVMSHGMEIETPFFCMWCRMGDIGWDQGGGSFKYVRFWDSMHAWKNQLIALTLPSCGSTYPVGVKGVMGAYLFYGCDITQSTIRGHVKGRQPPHQFPAGG